MYHGPGQERVSARRLRYTGRVDATAEACRADKLDLLLTYDWPYDEPFVGLLDDTLRAAGRQLLAVSPSNRTAVEAELRSGRRAPAAFLDRAADTDPDFHALESWAVSHVPLQLNPAGRRRQIWRKTNLHWEFISAGLHTPYTLVAPSLRRQPTIQPPDLTPLGVPFSIKPDLGGGGWGVVIDAQGWEDVERARQSMPDEDLILQQFVEPTALAGRRAWFRVLYACGAVIPCWWDDRTHLFGPTVNSQERWQLHLNPLWTIAQTAARIAQLHLFSTEVALVADGRFIVVDYVNDPVDLRFQPHAREGMPGEAARGIAEALNAYLAAHT